MVTRRLLFSCLMMLAAIAQAQAIPEPPTVGAGELPALLDKMKTGGYVLFFRHMDTRQDQEDSQPVDLNDCKAQRNLSEEGRARGAAIGKTLKQAKVPLGEVVSSPFCRTVESAKLMAGKTATDADLFFAFALTDAGKKQKGAALRKLIANPPAKGKNTIIVGHTANLQEAVGLWPKPEGVAYVFRPNGQGGIDGVARIAPEAWTAKSR